jgi:hypothetical protein
MWRIKINRGERKVTKKREKNKGRGITKWVQQDLTKKGVFRL